MRHYSDFILLLISVTPAGNIGNCLCGILLFGRDRLNPCHHFRDYSVFPELADLLHEIRKSDLASSR
jgi:hypothetical protein